jgi:3-oxoacyl-[acyl-carrier protein] reductase
MSKAVGAEGILVNCLAPGILDGGIGALLSDTLRDDYVRHCALKRLGTAREVAEWAAWLALVNTYVTGQTILLDGGL